MLLYVFIDTDGNSAESDAQRILLASLGSASGSRC